MTDRISALPDSICEHVLSFLPAKDAVRTCVLARRWRNVWTRSPSLRVTGDVDHRSVGRISNFVDHLLDVRLSGAFPAPLDSCAFDFMMQYTKCHHLDGKDGNKGGGEILYCLICNAHLVPVADDAQVKRWIKRCVPESASSGSASVTG
ncbi:hypothetical protein PR202_ga24607 [Eleusine coracana subsp. coracana]|uniref:F-box domain-containing protein n=1 Tax=Eleusine coracana subsp. coracana TaxID=191504 RepID=A0AAV5D7D1_ELECO|nr:hypothetical protein QOZ80_9AG0676990 [Eleusine coracana subsp. coracana]GJN06838.1 hypothetical protein PR202_ga24607 [Eleusine coracana subsp. coracana]